MSHSSDAGTDFFDIVIEVLQGDSLAPYMFIIRPYCVFRTSIDQSPMTDVDFTDDQVLLTNTSALAKTQLHSQEQAREGISPCMNANERELMCFKQLAISTLSGLGWLGLVLWLINHSMLFNAKLIFIHKSSSITSNSGYNKYTV